MPFQISITIICYTVRNREGLIGQQKRTTENSTEENACPVGPNREAPGGNKQIVTL